VVSAEGIEAARKRICNTLQAADLIRSGPKTVVVGQQSAFRAHIPSSSQPLQPKMFLHILR
jgi:hypothetical protein